MPNTNDGFHKLRESFQKFGQVFNEMEGAQLIQSFSSTTEEEYTPDPEQFREEELLGYETEILWAREAESNPSDKFIRDFRGTQCNYNPTHFVDGSVRSVLALDGLELRPPPHSNIFFPIIIGQIGAASIIRNTLNNPIKHRLETKVVLLIPLSQLSDTLSNQLTRGLVGTPLEDNIHDPSVSPQDGSSTLKDGEEKDYAKLRSHAGRRAKYEMTKVEAEVLEDCVGTLTDETELIVLDGPLIGMLKEVQMSEEKLHRVIGVSKSFSMRPLNLMGEYLKRSDCVSQLLNLEEGERTDAIELHIHPTWVVTWYQRIRPRSRVESPLDGIIKVETHFANYPAYESKDESNESRQFEKDWSQVWNDIANVIYAERFPIPFHEQRWHALLYPINCCERLLKSSFLSREVLQGLCSKINIQ